MKNLEVVVSKQALKDLNRVPRHVITKLYAWVEIVENGGIARARRISGFHDEPLKGKRKGQRSIRLSKAYRAFYRHLPGGCIQLIEVFEVNKHEY